MRRPHGGWRIRFVSAFAAIALSACVAAGYSDGGAGVDVGYVGGFYEPWGYDYGGWGPGYRVGPPGFRDHGRDGERGRPAGRAAPSIPRGSRGGVSGHSR